MIPCFPDHLQPAQSAHAPVSLLHSSLIFLQIKQDFGADIAAASFYPLQHLLTAAGRREIHTAPCYKPCTPVSNDARFKISTGAVCLIGFGQHGAKTRPTAECA
jgi:hypothetical protein